MSPTGSPWEVCSAGPATESAEAASASETMTALHRSELPPEMAIIDVRLPVTSGFELARQIAADPKLPPIPIVHISAEANGSDRIRGLEGGASAYLASPVAPEELLSTVERVLLARREEQAAHDERRFASDLQHAFLPGRRNWRRWRGSTSRSATYPPWTAHSWAATSHAAFAVERGVLLPWATWPGTRWPRRPS
ncbi:response regulator transcription factor [Streptomyces sp. KL116D]|uniref:response regulator transcription factor n=1 Tax=Streptomyces sp. KL116D TaxID=3045152 RepID=UPI003558CD0B